MIITCPNCGTQYSVDPVGFGRAAKTVRCFNCGNQWLQQPVVVPPVIQPQPQVPVMPQYYQMPPQVPAGYPPPPPGYPPMPPGYPPPPGYSPEDPMQQADSMPPEPDPVPEPSFDLDDFHEEEEEEEELVPLTQDINALFEEEDEETAAPEEPELTEEGGIPGAITPAEDPDLSDDDLENLFDENEAEEGISSMVEPSAEEGAGDDDIDNIDDIPEPEPLPESLTADISGDDMDADDEAPKPRRGRKVKAKKAKKKGSGLVIILFVFLLLATILGSLFFLRGLVLQYVPALGAVYEMVGLGAPLGDGLEIRNVNSERGTEGGVDFLLLSGNIANIAEEAKPVPLIKAILIDASDEIIQSVVQEPAKAEVPAGEVLGFTVKIEEPSPLARRLEVTFEPRPSSE